MSEDRIVLEDIVGKVSYWIEGLFDERGIFLTGAPLPVYPDKIDQAVAFLQELPYVYGIRIRKHEVIKQE
jgi:hypothetical protein